MSSIADGVLAATHKLVQQAMTGQWQDVPKTVQERRELLNSLSASASPQDRQWLGALQQAMAESDAAVAQMAAAAPATQNPVQACVEVPNTATVDSMMEMLKKSR
jgi:recombinational DNA repair ATPase RecF